MTAKFDYSIELQLPVTKLFGFSLNRLLYTLNLNGSNVTKYSCKWKYRIKTNKFLQKLTSNCKIRWSRRGCWTVDTSHMPFWWLGMFAPLSIHPLNNSNNIHRKMRKQNKGSRADGGASFKSTMSPMTCIWIIIIVIMIASTTTWRQCKCKNVFELFCWFLACAHCTNYTLGSLVGNSPQIAALHRLNWK